MRAPGYTFNRSIMATEIFNLNNALCFAIYSAHHAIARAYKPLLDPVELTYPQYLVLQTVGSIGQRLFLESSTLTPLLKRMEKAGHVRRERVAEDERQVKLFLTEAGRRLQGKLADIPQELLKAFGCGSQGAAILSERVAALRDTIGKAARRGS